MATYLRDQGRVVIESLQCDSCTKFDPDGFAEGGRCWVPLWSDGLIAVGIGRFIPDPSPARCQACGVALIGRR